MLNTPMDVLHQFPVRKTKKQKQIFQDAVTDWAVKQGYDVSVEKGYFGCCNLVFGDPKNAKYLLTAHYDTCSRMLVPNLIIPENTVLYVAYQFLVALLYAVVPIALSILLGIAALFWGGTFYRPDQGVELGAFALLVWFCSCALLYAVALMLPYFGPANISNANDNTSGIVTLLEIMRTLPENQRQKVCFVLFDQEETGLWGSRSFRKAHKQSLMHQLVLSLNCVGDGDNIRMYPSRQLRQNRKMLTSLYPACGYFGKKNILVCEKKSGNFPSDHKLFCWGVCIVALNKRKFGLYVGKIHTPKDTILDKTNVNILRAALTSLICCDEVN